MSTMQPLAHVPSGGGGMLRAQVIAQAWRRLGDEVAPLSNGSGRPLARTVKLVLEPLVIRPVQNPHLAGGTLPADAAAELAARIEAARDDLAATAAWFLVLKRARRALRITEGNPQEKYFQRCFELARTEGAPGPDAERLASVVVAEIAQAGGDALLSRVRDLLLDTEAADRLHDELVAAWAARSPIAPAASASAVAAALDACPTGEAATAFDTLIDQAAGSAASAALEDPGAARMLGLTAHDAVARPELGTTASKRDLPRPFDRSVYERLFAALSTGTAAEADRDAADVVDDEIARAAAPWELAAEQSRVVMLLGGEAAHALEPTELLRPTAAHRLLRGRWEREAYVRRALRLPAASSGVPAPIQDDIRTVRQGYLRRLWVRLHGRELRGQATSAAELWDTLDGVLRSVIMDQRHRLKTALGRDLEPAA